MNDAKDTLGRIAALREPRHMFILPDWADPVILDQLISEGYVTCQHHQRDEKGNLQVVMGLRLTPKGDRILQPKTDWRQLAVKTSLAGASFTVMSLVILYLG